MNKWRRWCCVPTTCKIEVKIKTSTYLGYFIIVILIKKNLDIARYCLVLNVSFWKLKCTD